VVDELHTFDGAQGTDLACLLRRLKTRLQTPAGHLCCAGTSATLGGTEHAERLCDYASQVFGETFDADAIIRESVPQPQEFFGDTAIDTASRLPGPEHLEALWADHDTDVTAYLARQAALWFDMLNAEAGSEGLASRTGPASADAPVLPPPHRGAEPPGLYPGRTRRRIGWEIASEYAFRRRIGRTLEKTGCSVAGWLFERFIGLFDGPPAPVVDKLCSFVEGSSGDRPGVAAGCGPCGRPSKSSLPTLQRCR
jgi:hypothetical protein